MSEFGKPAPAPKAGAAHKPVIGGVPKSLAAIAQRDPRIQELFFEEDHGYWVYLRCGFANHKLDPASPRHSIRCDTVADVKEVMRGVGPCDCDSCKGAVLAPGIIAEPAPARAKLNTNASTDAEVDALIDAIEARKQEKPVG